MGFAVLVQDHMYITVFISGALQIVGTAILGLFSFYGLKVQPSSTVFVSGNPATHVSISKGWVNVARAGLLLLLVGIFLGSMASLAGITTPAAA